MKKKIYTTLVGDKELRAEFNDLAEQAHGSVLLSYGNTVILATATMSKEPKEGSDFFPLTVEFEERFYATGKILGSQYTRREGKPSDRAILAGRVIDRTIRPLFDQYIRNEIQVIVTLLALDEAEPDALGVIAASLALATSNIPWNGPVSAVRVGLVEEKFYINPKPHTSNTNLLDLTICGKDKTINMIEAMGLQIDEDTVEKAFAFASEELEKIQRWQLNIIAEIGKEKTSFPKRVFHKKLIDLFEKTITPNISTIFGSAGKESIQALHTTWNEHIASDINSGQLTEEDTRYADALFDSAINDYLHTQAIQHKQRADGRTPEQIRELFVQAGNISEVLHGTGIFYRGGTHILSVATLAGPEEALTVEELTTDEHKKRYFHHYNFPPFSTGEPGRVGGTNRRMIGHGALAEKALIPVLPSQSDFPYTIRVVSEALASNGSTSMGSVCGSTIALMDAGVPIQSPVAGIASGLMMHDEKLYTVLTDIQGPEDEHGDMDFKVAGTRHGITAIQMDVKVSGIPLHILKESLQAAKVARLKILDAIESVLPKPRENLSIHVPKIVTTKIDVDDIGLVIGQGGKTIKDIQEKTQASISIEDDGTIYITGKGNSALEAKDYIEKLTKRFAVGDTTTGTVVKIADFGAFVKISPTTDGLVHVSEIAPFRIEKVSDYLSLGQEVPVMVKEIDEKGRINLSIKRAHETLFVQKT